MDLASTYYSSNIVIHDVHFRVLHSSDHVTAREAVFSVLWVVVSNQEAKILTVWTAPAAKAVEYNRVKFNATMGEGSPYVGSGPEVDKAWHAISYDS